MLEKIDISAPPIQEELEDDETADTLANIRKAEKLVGVTMCESI